MTLTILVGIALGAGAAWFLPRRTGLIILGRQVFNGSAVEAFLFILGVALFAFSLGDANIDGSCFVPSVRSPMSSDELRRAPTSSDELR